ncbi:MAG TPA: hypothetical protein VK155_18120, partial [Bacteroidales bacterium]|nr:hypothetical protein [Bacteroidales bacterium]
MYHVSGTLTVATLLYLISFYFYRAGFYSLLFHRKLWNVILASAFIATASAGIFLALQVNHKWDFSFIKTILKWHVEFGIGMAVTGLFHLIWHLSYYTGIFRKQGQKSAERRADGREQRTVSMEHGAWGMRQEEQYAVRRAQSGEHIKTSLFVVGFVSSAIQLLFLREIMNITGGYELISGVFFGSWLITSAAGSVMAGRSSLNNMRRILLTFSFSPLVSLFLMIFLSRLFMITGQTPSFLESFIYTLLVIGPFCFVSGFTFVRLLETGRQKNPIKAGYYFSIETLGGVLAGILISVMTAGLFNTYELLLLIIMLAMTFMVLNFLSPGKFLAFTVKLLTVILATLILGAETDREFRQLLLPGVRITSTRDTPYGNLTSGEYGNEQSTFYNQRLLKYSADAAEREEDIHYAMLQCDNPEKVLLISGSLLSHLPEIKKYPVKKITYIERDPALIESEVNDSVLSDPGIEISDDDAFTFIRETDRKFDVIMLLVPPPSTLLLNRYYTTGFFSSVKEKLDNRGVFMCSPGLAQNYYNRESLLVISSVYNSMKKVFSNVLPVSGTRLYFVASDNKLSPEITSLVTSRGIQNLYVGPDYLSDDLIAQKSSEIMNLIDPGTNENTLSHPVACMSFQSLIFSMKASEKIPSIFLLILLFAAPVIAVKRRHIIMYTGACSMAGFEIILLLSLQLSVGNMYALTGLVIASVMTGLAAGALMNLQLPGKSALKSKVLLLAMFYLLAALLLSNLQSINNHFIAIILLLVMSFIPGMLTGNFFREITAYKDSGIAGVYSADLAGSAAGFIIISAIAVPVAGITWSVILL